MPAAAVIPAPIAYIKVVAVKKLVVGFLEGAAGPRPLGACTSCISHLPCGDCVGRLCCLGQEPHHLL